ncbi:MAG TPA: porin [Novosphingobium sp.]|nr:porin [Novosphingobium sp.]
MTRRLIASATALAIASGWALPASAQDAAAVQQELAAMRAEMARMAARIDTLEGQLVQARSAAETAQATAASASQQAAALAAAPPPAPAAPAYEVKWKGAPELSSKDGWSFKPRGRLHLDAGAVSHPGSYENRNLGFNHRVRRVRLGAEGTMPGGFGYKAEVDFANSATSFGEVFVSYTPKTLPIQIRAGSFETLNGLEQISSSNYVTFIERAAMNDAFLNARRLGAAVAWHSKDDDWRAEVGLFAGHAIDGSFDNDGWIGAARLVYAPEALGGQLHLGLNYQHREFASNNGGGASSGTNMVSTNQLARYRARPNSQLTDVRFVDTGSFAAKSDRIIGLEAAGVFGPFHLAGEAQWLKADAYAAGDTATGLAAFTGGNTAVTPLGNPGFFAGYAELGWFITGETRAYKRGDGTWARTKVRNPLSKGGPGAFQLATRFEYVDLDDDALKAGLTNNFTTGLAAAAPLATRLGRGGTQTSYLVALNWLPSDYVRLMLNYGRIEVEGGPIAVLARPGSTAPADRRRYGVDVLQTRIQLDF